MPGGKSRSIRRTRRRRRAQNDGCAVVIAALFIGLLLFGTAGMLLAQPPSVEQAQAWYETIVDWAVRPAVTAIVAGVVLAFVIPQRVKLDFPPYWSDRKRRMRTRLTSFLAGSIGTAALWPIGWDWAGMQLLDSVMVAIGGLFCAVVVGASAPYTYTVIVGWLAKRGFWRPASGEECAERKRLSTGTPIESE